MFNEGVTLIYQPLRDYNFCIMAQRDVIFILFYAFFFNLLGLKNVIKDHKCIFYCSISCFQTATTDGNTAVQSVKRQFVILSGGLCLFIVQLYITHRRAGGPDKGGKTVHAHSNIMQLKVNLKQFSQILQ